MKLKPEIFPLPKTLHVLPDTCPGPLPVERWVSDDLPAQGYRLRITREGCRIESADAAGAFYAEQTLTQILHQFEGAPPALEIEDGPDFPVRGLYHDISRGKVPTLETLKLLADFCASCKLNQLQLYVEHTYAFQAFPDVWQYADPLTAEEIRELDTYCLERHIELVPSFTTFGHFYPFIHTPRFQHLNELERDVSGDPFNWWDRMAHYTLDPANPESARLVETLIREVGPLFRSHKFNLCADETFDLGKGRNRETAEAEGTGRLYLDFINQTIRVIKDCGSTPMMWADIVGKHPELVEELEEGVILLDWAYDPELKGSYAELLHRTGRPFYVCSGISGWNTFVPDYTHAAENILNFAHKGYEHGAGGVLVTDWGDYGHIGPLALAYPGMMLAASSAWNLAETTASAGEMDARISRLAFGDPSGKLCGLLREVSDAGFSIWRSLAFWKQPRSQDMPDDWFDSASGLPNMFFDHSAEDHCQALETILPLQRLCGEVLAECAPVDPHAPDDIRFALRGMVCGHHLGLFLLDRAGRNPAGIPVMPADQLAARLVELEAEFERIWMARNKPSEYREIRKVLQAVLADVLEEGR